jgi:outer membrane immunogenic protein
VVNPALAADMPTRPIYKAPPPVVYGWSGFYGGVNIGYSWGRHRNDWFVSGVAFSESEDMNGIIGGVQWGYNWQLGNYVLGTESDIQASGQRGSTFYCLDVACTTTANVEHRLSWFGTARTRLGVLPLQQLMLYVTGGVAYGQVRSDYTFTGLATGTVSVRDPRVGWTVGAGIEGMLSRNWSAKLEYLYVDLGKYTVTQLTPAGATVFSLDSRVDDHIVRLGVNYRFGG